MFTNDVVLIGNVGSNQGKGALLNALQNTLGVVEARGESAAASAGKPPVILRRREVEKRTGLGRSALYNKFRQYEHAQSQYDPTFPKPVRLGPRAVGWLENEIDAWVLSRAAAR